MVGAGFRTRCAQVASVAPAGRQVAINRSGQHGRAAKGTLATLHLAGLSPTLTPSPRRAPRRRHHCADHGQAPHLVPGCSALGHHDDSLAAAQQRERARRHPLGLRRRPHQRRGGAGPGVGVGRQPRPKIVRHACASAISDAGTKKRDTLTSLRRSVAMPSRRAAHATFTAAPAVAGT